MAYTIEKLNEATWLIDGAGKESMYLIAGSEKALLIDTGMEKDGLLDAVRTLTDKPVEVVLTHGHIDHIGRTGEFEKVYLDPADLDLFKDHSHLSGMEGLCFHDPDSLLPLPQQFDLGGLTVYTVVLPGHTPGSVIFADPAHGTVFTGDAIGSGCGCLMLIEGALPMSEYRASLDRAAEELEKLGATEEWKFYGGHNSQEYMSRVADYNRLDLRLLKDMSALCTKLLDGGVIPEPTDKHFPGNRKPYYAAYGKAEMDVAMESIY